MELEEMKALWGEMSEELSKQKKLTDKLIVTMTQERYKNKIRNIWVPELLGSLVCFAIFLAIVFNFDKLDTWYLQACGIFSAAFYLAIPIMSLNAIHRMRSIDLSGNNYKQTIIAFAKAKKHFLFVQKLGFYLSFILIIACLPVATVLLDGKDILQGSTVWYWYLPLGVLFLFFFARWIFRYYMRTTNNAEALLADLE